MQNISLTERHFAPEPFLVETNDGRIGYVILIPTYQQSALVKMQSGPQALKWFLFNEIKPISTQTPTEITIKSATTCLGTPVQELC